MDKIIKKVMKSYDFKSVGNGLGEFILVDYRIPYSIMLEIKEEAQKEIIEKLIEIFKKYTKYKETYPNSGVFTGDTKFNHNLFEKELLKLRS